MGELSRKLIKDTLKLICNHKDSIFNGIGNFAFGGISTSAIMKWHDHKKNKIEKRTDARIKEFNNIYKEFRMNDSLIHTSRYKNKITTEYVLRTHHFSKYHVQYPQNILSHESKWKLKRQMYIQAYRHSIEELILWCKRIFARPIDMKYFSNQVGNRYIKLIKHHKIILQQYNTRNQIKLCYSLCEDIKSQQRR